jgi:hypothetical protein
VIPPGVVKIAGPIEQGYRILKMDKILEGRARLLPSSARSERPLQSSAGASPSRRIPILKNPMALADGATGLELSFPTLPF